MPDPTVALPLPMTLPPPPSPLCRWCRHHDADPDLASAGNALCTRCALETAYARKGRSLRTRAAAWAWLWRWRITAALRRWTTERARQRVAEV